MKVLFVVNAWPDDERPWYGSWVKRQADSVRRLGVDIEPLPIRGYVSKCEYLRAAVDVAKRTSTHRYDIVHANYGHSGLVGRAQHKVPLIVTYCGDDLLGTRDETGRVTTPSRAETMVFRQLAWVASATITKSSAMEQRLPAARRHRNWVIPNGVDLTKFTPLAQREARARLGWDDEAEVLLFVGDPEVPGKNFALARAVLDHAQLAFPRARLHIAWGIEPTQMPVLMNAANVLLITSRSEGSPNAVKEAMAVGLPIVSTPVGDVPERLEGLDRCYVRPATAPQLAEAVIALLRDGGRSASAPVAISKLSLEAVAHQIVGVYRDVLERSRASSGPAG